MFSVLIKYPPGDTSNQMNAENHSDTALLMNLSGRICESIHCIRVIFGYFTEKCLSDKYEFLYHDWKNTLSPITTPSLSVYGAYRK